VNPIRPNIFPGQQAPITPAAGGADAARAAAQKAFFDAAMGRANAPSAAPAPAPAPQAAPVVSAARPSFFAALTTPPQRPEIRPDPAAEAPSRVLRPGSLLDIRV
jgi:hypothetical protein